MVQSGQIPCAILFYHRVDDQETNSWTISRKDFAKQINWFEKNFDLVDLSECQRRIRSGNNKRPTLAITFDDGYADNCAYALPMLIRKKIPVTYFVTTHHITTGSPFAHDLEQGTPLPTNSVESLRALSRAGVEIGGHTRHHPDLGKMTDESKLFDEVISATKEMEALIGQPIRYFAFPFGQRKNLNPTVFRLLRDHGFAGACSAYGGLNHIGDDDFHLQRLHGDPVFARVKNWLTYDPRIMNQERYDYKSALVFSESATPNNLQSVTP